MDTIVTSTTEMAMDRLRRNPIQISLRMNCSRMGGGPSCGRGGAAWWP